MLRVASVSVLRVRPLDLQLARQLEAGLLPRLHAGQRLLQLFRALLVRLPLRLQAGGCMLLM